MAGHEVVAGAHVPPGGASRPLWADRSFRSLLVLLVAATPLLVWAGSDEWFFSDDWDLLLRRDLADPVGLFDAWYGHNVALPAVAYRILLEVFGASSYRPYQALSILGHYSVVIAVWAVARRLGVRPWLSVVAVVPLVVFGSGRFNILFGFQITMTAALSLTLAHLLLADRDGAWSRRDTLGVICGGAGLLCSGVAVVGTVGVGAAVLLRRGPVLAALHTVPLGVAWGVWRVAVPEHGQEATTRFDERTMRFVIELPKSALGALAASEPVALAVGAVVVLGVVATLLGAARMGPSSVTTRQASRPVLVGCLVTLGAFATFAGAQQLPWGQRSATEPRYAYVVVALVIPLFALGVEVIARRDSRLALVPLALVALGLPSNIRSLDDEVHPAAQGNFLVAVASSEQFATASDTSLGVLAVFFLAQGLGAEDAQAVADLPGIYDGAGVTPEVQLRADLVLGLELEPDTDDPGCPEVGHVRRALEPGDAIDFVGRVRVVAIDGVHRSVPVAYGERGSERRARLTATGPLTVEATAPPGSAVLDCSDGQ